MNIETYKIEHDIEQLHWWFFARRKMFKKLILKLQLPLNATILDVGSSSGTNMRMLKDMGFCNYSGMDISPEAQKFCHEKNLGKVFIGDIQTYCVSKNCYDLILLTDVLEHLEDDNQALANIFYSLKSGGTVLITVPCFPFLWGPQDIVSNHLRRYNKTEIENKIMRNRFCITKSFYFNFLLFFPIFIIRKLLLWQEKIINENKINNSFINMLMKAVFITDCFISAKLNIPFGVSLCIVAKKT